MQGDKSIEAWARLARPLTRRVAAHVSRKTPRVSVFRSLDDLDFRTSSDSRCFKLS